MHEYVREMGLKSLTVSRYFIFGTRIIKDPLMLCNGVVP
jgi:hypothetical protein